MADLDKEFSLYGVIYRSNRKLYFNQKNLEKFFVPKKEREVNYNFGRAWVDKNDFSILKIDYDPKSIKDYEDELLQSPIGDLSKNVIWTTHFGVEKNGVRFPSQQLIQEFYVNSEGESLLIEKIIFRYEDYKFFIVETEVKYK